MKTVASPASHAPELLRVPPFLSIFTLYSVRRREDGEKYIRERERGSVLISRQLVRECVLLAKSMSPGSANIERAERGVNGERGVYAFFSLTLSLLRCRPLRDSSADGCRKL